MQSQPEQEDIQKLRERIAELESLEPIAKVALRLDAIWCEFEDMQYLDETMNNLYEVCSAYRNRVRAAAIAA